MAKLKLRATRVDHYVSKKGNVTFRYIVDGDEESLKKYEEAQGANYRTVDDEDSPHNGKPLYFTTQPLAKQLDLMITINDKVIPAVDTDDVAEKVLNHEERVLAEMAKLQAQARLNRNKVTAAA